LPDASEPLLRMLRELMHRKELNTAALADAAGLDRTRVRRVLKGTEPMTVTELLALGQALHIGPADLGWPDLSRSDGGAADAPPLEPTEGNEPDDALGLDPWGNHPEQLFRAGFELGCDFMFVARTSELGDSGIPMPVLAQFAERDLPIKLDAAYHRYNQPRYEPDAITLTLSFDALYDCRFPWSSIRQVLFFPAPPEPSQPEEEEEDSGDRPVLRLVT
jgi:transcriptional regulator with XRE-family HTH domain